MKKHAYLIMAHNNFPLLAKLLTLLDDERNDIYLHVDKKAKEYNPSAMNSLLRHASLTQIKRENVAWAGYSQIRVELRLLESAVKCEHSYYHLLSGVDLPLKSQDEIHDFFARNDGKEFVCIDGTSRNGFNAYERIGIYHFFQDRIGRNQHFIMSRIEKGLIETQVKLHIDRTRANNSTFYKGAQWFSISHSFALYLLSIRKRIVRTYSYYLGADELFVQTELMQSPFASNIANNCMREIDWKRGTPYTWDISDYEYLMQSKALFARKFDYEKRPEIVDRICEQLSKC